MDKKKFYIIEIIVSTILIAAFIAALFIKPQFKDVTIMEAHFLTIYIRAIILIAIGGMGIVVVSRAERLKNPTMDYNFLIHYDDK